MNRNEFGPIKNFVSAGAIKPRRVVAFAAADGAYGGGFATTFYSQA